MSIPSTDTPKEDATPGYFDRDRVDLFSPAPAVEWKETVPLIRKDEPRAEDERSRAKAFKGKLALCAELRAAFRGGLGSLPLDGRLHERPGRAIPAIPALHASRTGARTGGARRADRIERAGNRGAGQWRHIARTAATARLRGSLAGLWRGCVCRGCRSLLSLAGRLPRGDRFCVRQRDILADPRRDHGGLLRCAGRTSLGAQDQEKAARTAQVRADRDATPPALVPKRHASLNPVRRGGGWRSFSALASPRRTNSGRRWRPRSRKLGRTRASRP